MNRPINLFVALFFLAFVALGCRFLSSSENGPANTPAPTPAANSNRTLTDKAIDSAVGRSHVGIAECDSVLDAIEAELNNPDDNYVIKAAKATVLNQIKESIKQEVERNANKADAVEMCREFQKQFEKFKAEQQSGKK